MPRRGQRKKIDPRIPNIYVDATGIAVVVKGQPELRFPHGTTTEQLETERDALKAKARGTERPRVGSLAADVVDYLKTIVDKNKLKNAAMLCRHWTATYGRESRFALTKLRIDQQLTAWERDGVAASTCNKRLGALRSVFNTVNEDHQSNPAAKVKKRKEPEGEARALDYATIERILRQMPDRGRPVPNAPRSKVSLAKLRCAVMAYTGLPPAQMIRIKPDTDLAIHSVLVDTPLGQVTEHIHALRARPRRKGKGTKETWIQLIPQGYDAIAQLHRAGGLKPFSTSSLRASWHRACAHVVRDQLANGEPPLPHRIQKVGDELVIVPLIRPYDLRHSFLTAALRASKGNLVGVQHLGQHADIRQTRRYIAAAVPQAASDVALAVQHFLPTVAVPQHEKAKALAPLK